MFVNKAIITGPNAPTLVETKPTPSKRIREELKTGRDLAIETGGALTPSFYSQRPQVLFTDQKLALRV